jgi:hypothetical protein
MNIDHKWEAFLRNNASHTNPFLSNIQKPQGVAESRSISSEPTPPRILLSSDEFARRISPLNISTQTKSMFLNTAIDIGALFEYISIIPYVCPGEGIIKKQIILETFTFLEAQQLYEKWTTFQASSPVEVSIKVPAAFRLESPPDRYKYRFHISVGFYRKNFKKPSKCAFSHCIALTIRVWFLGKFNDTHIKIFNTGKIEIPGKFVPEYIEKLKETVSKLIWDALAIRIVQYTDEPVAFVNSNFGVPFVVDLEKFYQILTHTYNLNTNLDICKFHGIKCLFYYNKELPDHVQTGQIETGDHQLSNKKLKLLTAKYMPVHFICYKTGKCLIAGKCSETVLYVVYSFFVQLFIREYANIYEDDRIEEPETKPTNHKRSIKINVTRDYADMLAAKSLPVLEAPM